MGSVNWMTTSGRCAGSPRTAPSSKNDSRSLEGLIGQRRAFSAQIVEVYRRDGAAAAAALISAGRGRAIMNRIGSVVDAVDRRERDRLTQREAENEVLTARTLLILPVGSFIGLSVLLVVLFSLNSEATERRQADSASRTAAAIVESTGDAVVTKTLGGVITSWNPGAELILGYTAPEAVGRPAAMLIPPERANEEEEILGRIQRGERVEHFETVRVRKDGRRIDASVTVSPIRDDAGRITGAAKILRDVTEQKATAAALLRLGARLTTTVENMQAAFFTVDLEWRFTYINRECERLLRRTRAELLGKRLWDEFKEAIGGPSDRHYHQAMAENRAVAFEEFYPPLGLWLEASAYPSSEGLAVYFRDITERKQRRRSPAREPGTPLRHRQLRDGRHHHDRRRPSHRALQPRGGTDVPLRRREVIGQPLDAFIPPRFRGAHSRHVEQFGAARRDVPLDGRPGRAERPAPGR